MAIGNTNARRSARPAPGLRYAKSGQNPNANGVAWPEERRHTSPVKNRFASLLFSFLCCLGCGSDDEPLQRTLLADGAVSAHIELPDGAGEGLRFAAEDLATAMAAGVGVEEPARIVFAPEPGLVVRVVVMSDDALGQQDYRIVSNEQGVVVEAGTEQGASYGLYELVRDVGVRYIHPEETALPIPDETLALGAYDGDVEVPRFDRRGFHEHTQHPIVASDFYLRPGDDMRVFASNYLRWLFRNRQNVASFHMLRTVELDTWTPYIQDINAEADALFIETGVVIGFVDEQQNAFKTYRPEDDSRPAEVQIPENIDNVLAGNFDFLTFQIGASEFTTPATADLLDYLSLALDHIQSNYPEVTMGTWIHITCDLEADDGSNFFHLPARADEAIRAWVHTTMFYTLEHPAPVYECEDFHHQRDFYDLIADQDREREFFPETAWWLGFDNNVPLELPIYGWSRAWDIQNELDETTTGHVTFTSGREWGYWRYDHYLTQVTWDAELSWSDYLADISGVFEDGENVTRAIQEFTDLQVRHFYEESPELFFYVAGELPQDEVGALVGVLARRPKLAYRTVLDYTDAEFAEWETSDLAALRSMREEYAAVALEDATGDDARSARHQEAVDAMRIFVLRLEQAIAIYEGVAALRPWWVSSRLEMPDEALRDPARTEAMAALVRSREATTAARRLINAGDDRYRYPAELLTAPKPESLTIYPIGYLEQTRTGFFWTRRDDQLESLISVVVDTSADAWEDPDPMTVFVAPQSMMNVVVPDDALVAAAIGGLLPSLLFGYEEAVDGALEIRVAQDTNGNERPDVGTEQVFPGTLSAGMWSSEETTYPIVLRGGDGAVLATLSVVGLTASLDFEETLPQTGRLVGNLVSAEVVGAIEEITGTDPESSAQLIKQVYDIEPDAELPAELPFEVDFVVQPAF